MQTNTENSLDEIDAEGLTAMGVLYSGSMLTWFNQSANANDQRVQFWAIKDEPDSGPGSNGAVTLISDLCDSYYEKKGKTTTNKPFSLNIMRALNIEEYAFACDIIMSDPYVWENAPDNNTERIPECVTEMNRNAAGIYSAKKTVVVLWWWQPKASNPLTDANSAAIYKTSFEEVKDDVDGLAGFTFSGDGNKLDTYVGTEALWDEVVEQNDNV